MQTRKRAEDVVIVGAGPAGCVAALSFAERGACVLVLEASRELPRRLAGEWLHPAATDILGRWGVAPPQAHGCSDVRGFVVFPHDATAPIELPYGEGRRGSTYEHTALVAALRERVRADRRIRLLDGARVTAIERGALSYARPDAPEARLAAGLIVGADGRSSSVRRLAGFPGESAPVSAMAGLLLEDVDPPFEGFGHVLLGGWGPALLYRIGSRRFRACFDVPLALARRPDRRARLGEVCARALPEAFRAPLRRALEDREVAWAANSFQSRSAFVREGVALVGDAVGHFHPLTAVGLTLGFQDAVCLAQSPSLAAYERERSSRSLFSELLATSLYQAFLLADDGGRAVCAAIYDVWRRESEERRRTMRYLSAEGENSVEFPMTFFKVMTRALEGILLRTAATREWSRAPGQVRSLSGWLKWPTAGVLPRFLHRPLGLGASSRRSVSA